MRSFCLLKGAVGLTLTLSVLLPGAALGAGGPAITTQPQSQSILAGSNATFTVVASGQTPLSYQWSFDGTNLANNAHVSGATRSTLTVSNVAAADAGNYQVMVSNSHGSVSSSNATLTVLFPPGIATPVSDETTYLGGAASFSVSATGTAPLNYQWYFNGAPLTDNGQITGSATAVLNIADVMPANVGSYQVTVTNNYGSVTSAPATLAATNRVHYVNLNNPSPVPPYGSWSTAAANIQDAVDVAVAGDAILVSNGIYTAGSRVTSATTNCVVVTNAISISSVSGPAQTIIDGGGTNRCIYLTDGCALSGFTVTNGATSENGGGIYCTDANVIVTNCVAVGNSASQGGGICQGTLIDCVVSGNSATAGGGVYSCTVLNSRFANNTAADIGGAAYFSTLNDCVLISNSVSAANAFSTGGGAIVCTLSNCTLVANSAYYSGGGAYQSTLFNCTLSGNVATFYGGGGVEASTLYGCILSNNFGGQVGGGADVSTLNNCSLIANVSYYGGAEYNSTNVNSLIVSNTAYVYGGGVYFSTLSNCVLSGNSAGNSGGGAYFGTLLNCLITGNSAASDGGGAEYSWVNNCTVVGNSAGSIGGGVYYNCNVYNSIVYFNTAPYGNNWYDNSVTFDNSCTTPSPGTGANNISSAPIFVDAANGNYRLSPGSPGIDGGDTLFVQGAVDLDGNPRIIEGTVDMGAYETPNPPVIDVQPASQTVPYGEPDVSISVTAVGTGVLAYQWQFDGTNVPGATSSAFTLNFAQYSSAGIYSVLVTNDFGATVSSNAVLTVVAPTPPAFATSPTNQTIAAGSNVTLTVVATGAPPPAYQWYYNGAALADNANYSGSGSATLQILNAQTNESGNYFAIASNTGGAATSSVASVTILMPPTIVLQPASQIVPADSNVTFTAGATGGAPLGFQWLFNGNPLAEGGQFSGTTTTNLTISNLQWANIGNYALLATNPVGSATSTAAVLTVLSPPLVTTPFTNVVSMVFSNVTLSLSVTGTQPLFYQWQKGGINLSDGGNITGSGGSNLNISDPQLTDSGQYSVIVSNAYGAVTNTAALEVVPVLSWGENVMTPPATATNGIGIGVTDAGGADNADFLVRADGSLVGWGDDQYNILEGIPSNDTNFVSITGGNGPEVIAIRQDGTLALWGSNGGFIPANATNVVAAATHGGEGSMALLQNGTLVAWGGAPTPPANATNIIAIGFGPWGLGSFLAARQDGTLIAWGDNVWGETTVPVSATNVVAVSCGRTHSLALRADGTVVAFGTGAGTPPTDLTNVSAVAAGWANSVVLRQDGTVEGWGDLGSAPAGISNCVAIAADGNQDMLLVGDPSVTAPPQIVQQPLGATAQINSTVILEGNVVGALPIQYQWYFNGAPLAGQTNRWLLLSPIQDDQGGGYQFVATNNFGAVTSLTAVVWTPPIITNAPAASVAFGSNAVLSVGVEGTTPLSYQWSFNGTPLTDGGQISGSATATLTIANFQPADMGNYSVTVANQAGSATSAATVTVLDPLLSTQPQSQSVFGGATVTFSVNTTGQQPLAYQWQFDGTNLPGATNDPLVLSNVQVSQSGTYSVVVTNVYGAIASSNATLTVTALTIAGPQNQSVLGGATATFTVTVNGQAPFAYQWMFDGFNLAGATNNPLVLSNVMVSEAGMYSVVVANDYGMAVSSNASLTVTALVITTQPTNRITWPNGPTAFKVNVSGTPPFSFDWRVNGVDIPGTWTNVLTLTNVQPWEFGTYDVIVSNAYGTAVSSNATLSLSQVAVWGGNLGESNLTTGLTNVMAIAGGGTERDDCLALRSNFTAIHWPSTNIFAVTNILAIGGGSGELTQQGIPFVVLKTNGVVSELLVDDIVTPIAGLTNAVAIAPEETYVPVAVSSNGTVVLSSVGTAKPPSVPTSNAVAVAEGNGFGLVLNDDGTVLSFGTGVYGQTNVPAGLSNVVAIAAAFYTSYALKSDGTVTAWGYNTNGEANVPASATNVVAIAAGAHHALALTSEGTVVAWGLNAYGQTNVPVGMSNVVAISAGANHSMALVGDGPPVVSAFVDGPILGTNGANLFVPSQSGRVFRLQYKNSLTDSNWVSLPLVPGNGGELLLVDPTATNAQRFYRVQRW